MNPKVDAQCTLALEPAALVVTYSIENEEDRDLGVFNRIPASRLDATSDFSPNHAYVDLEGGVLGVRQMALPVPKGLHVAAYSMPFATRIEPGKRLQETIRLPRPVRVCHPFKRALLKGEVVADTKAEATSVRVEIGIFLTGDDCRLIQEHPAFPDVLSASPPGPARLKQISLVWTFDLQAPLDVLDYRVASW